jgi:hypothetical protein
MKTRKTSFINLMKVLGALVNPKGITNHSYKPNLVLKAIFHSSPNSIRIIRVVFNALRDAHLFGNLEKCNFCMDRVSFLGYVVTLQGIEVDHANVEAIHDWPIPKNLSHSCISRRRHSDSRTAAACDVRPDHVWTWIQVRKYFLKISWSLVSYASNLKFISYERHFSTNGAATPYFWPIGPCIMLSPIRTCPRVEHDPASLRSSSHTYKT